MRKELDSIKIGETTYNFDRMPGEKQFLLSLKVAEAFGGVCASALPLLGVQTGMKLGEANVKALLGKLDLKEMGETIADITSKIDPVKTMEITKELMPHWFIVPAVGDGQRATFDAFADGKMGDLYKVLAASIRYYFEDFIKGFLSNGKAPVEVAPDA